MKTKGQLIATFPQFHYQDLIMEPQVRVYLLFAGTDFSNPSIYNWYCVTSTNMENAARYTIKPT